MVVRAVRAILISAAIAALAGCSTRDEIVGSGCENCHRPASSAEGIEEQHALFALRCVECHGGNPEGKSVLEAHVAELTPMNVPIRERSIGEMAATDPSYRRFINPGDPVVAAQTCGSAGPQGSNGCHQAIVDASAVSVHATAVGIASQPRYASGAIAERTGLGVRTIVDEDFMPASAGEGAIGKVDGIGLPALPAVPTSSDAAVLYDYALGKNCSGCHLEVYGSNGQGRINGPLAGGCTACHMYYDDDGKSMSKDPARNTQSGVHPVQHVISRTVPDKQCLRCHSRSLRIGQHWRGWRERTIGEDAMDLRNAQLIAGEIHGRPANYFLELEDSRDPIDYTPPDIHLAKGMSCVDCHLAPDGHGDGTMKESMSREVQIECEDCHGTFEAEAGLSGMFVTSRGTPITRLRREGENVILRGAIDGVDHPVTQVIKVRPSTEEEAAHNLVNHGSMECYACHTSWMQNVYSLRRTVDYRGKSKNPIDGREENGLVTDFDEIQVRGPLGNPSIDPNAITGYHLGMNAEGKISPLMVENARLDVIISCDPSMEPAGTCVRENEQQLFGKKIIDGWYGQTRDGKRGLEWRPTFPHATATAATVQACAQCHPRELEISATRVRSTYGFGSGRFMAVDPRTAEMIDLTQMIDTNGNILVALPQPGSAPVPQAMRDRALNYVLPPQ